MGAFATLDESLEQARSSIDRLTPVDALRAQRDGDIADGNVLEWRLAPSSWWRLAETADRMVFCHGCQSSLAAYALRQLGLPVVFDADGGFEAWRAGELAISGPEEVDRAHPGGTRAWL